MKKRVSPPAEFAGRFEEQKSGENPLVQLERFQGGRSEGFYTKIQVDQSGGDCHSGIGFIRFSFQRYFRMHQIARTPSFQLIFFPSA